jgi:chemotaxis protein CheZ
MADSSVTPALEGNAQLQSMPDPFDGFEAPLVERREAGCNLAIGLATIRHVEIPQAIERLDDIVRGTECAANQVMDACAALEAVGQEIGGEIEEQIGRALTTIYEACGFQDLAGQRIASVTKTLGLIEGKLSDLTSEYGILAGDDRDTAVLVGNDGSEPFGNVRLDGPQHPENATNQASIDHLFAQIS